MLWIFLALLAPLLWAISNLIDGDLVLNRIKNPLVIMTVTGLFSVFPFLFIILTNTFSWPRLSVILFGVLTGFVSLLAFYPYFRALENSHPTSALLLWNVSPVITAVAAFVFLNERLSPYQYLAVLLLIGSAIIAGISSGTNTNTKKKQSNVGWMLLASLLTATQAIMSKWLFGQTSTGTGVGLISLGSFGLSASFFLIPSIRKQIPDAFSKHSKILILNETLSMFAFVCSSFAIGLGSVSLVKAIEGVQAFFVFGFSWIAARIFSRKQFRIAESPKAGLTILACVIAVVGLMLI